MDSRILAEYGVDYADGVKRCLNDPGLFSQVLLLFLEDTSFSRAKDAFLQDDDETAFNALHELKGVCGNASLSELYAAVCPLVEALRGKATPEKELDALFISAERAYHNTCRGIRLSMGLPALED